MTGEGRDRIGPFLIRGKYNVDDGKCHWSKRYIGKHDVAYQGYNEGKGIWGIWEIPPSWRGGFHIWPRAMGDPTSPHLAEAIDEPAEAPTDAGGRTRGRSGVGSASASPSPNRSGHRRRHSNPSEDRTGPEGRSRRIGSISGEEARPAIPLPPRRQLERAVHLQHDGGRARPTGVKARYAWVAHAGLASLGSDGLGRRSRRAATVRERSIAAADTAPSRSRLPMRNAFVQRSHPGFHVLQAWEAYLPGIPGPSTRGRGAVTVSPRRPPEVPTGRASPVG